MRETKMKRSARRCNFIWNEHETKLIAPRSSETEQFPDSLLQRITAACLSDSLVSWQPSWAATNMLHSAELPAHDGGNPRGWGSWACRLVTISELQGSGDSFPATPWRTQAHNLPEAVLCPGYAFFFRRTGPINQRPKSVEVRLWEAQAIVCTGPLHQVIRSLVGRGSGSELYKSH